MILQRANEKDAILRDPPTCRQIEPQSRKNDEATDLNAPLPLNINHRANSIIMKALESDEFGATGPGMWRLR
jgi:hypothetical protein